MIPVDFTVTAPVAPVMAAAPAPTLTLDALATRIAGKPAHVVCKTADRYRQDPVVAGFAATHNGNMPLGYEDPPNGLFVMPSGECDAVTTELIADPRGTSFPASAEIGSDAVAVFVFFHEASHVAEYPDGPWADEHATDCRALSVMPRVLAAVGVPAARASWFERSAAAIHAATPPPYAGACS